MSETVYNALTGEHLPMLALRGLSVFPNMLLNFDVERPMSVAALNAAADGARKIFLLAQKDISKESPAEADLYRVGTICVIKQLLRIPGGGIKVLVEGVRRASLTKILNDRKYFYCEVEPIYEEAPEKVTARVEALIRKSVNLFDTYSTITGNVSRDAVISVFTATEPGYIADFVAQHLYLKPEKKQLILETLSPVKRLELICDMLLREIDVVEIEQQIDERLRGRLERQQRDHVLREQLRVIQSELGEAPEYTTEFDEYRHKIAALKLSAEIEKKLLREVERLEKQQAGSSEAAVIRNYLDICLELPWHAVSKERTDIALARKILDADHFGLEKVKERIVEFIAVRQLSHKANGTILCLVGPPGVGKTSIAISVAKALNRKLARLSLGGIHDEAEIRGHRKTYVGAMPGRIIAAISQAGTKNPLLLLDEIDKLGSDYRGDPSSALLEALDPEQNATFRDHYLELPFDLSETMFITTANTTSTIPRPLLDRMEVIELSSYTDVEKLHIARDHLLPKQRKKHGLTSRQLKISDDAIMEMISSYTRESGVRLLEREIAAACRKTASKIVAGEIKSASLNTGMLEEYLGVRKFKPENIAGKDEIGLVKGLAWTSVGGETLDVEVSVLDGSGKLELTGNLGEIMKESAHAAVTYIRSRAEWLGIDPDFYKNRDIHIHFPEGAVPKDGPSAGIAITVAVISALAGAPVRRDLAMTGEITLRGRILAIGGLKEKTMAAMRAGIKTVIIPAENEPNLEEIDQTVRRALNFVTADHIDNIIKVALDFSSVVPFKPEEALCPVLGESGDRVESGPSIRQ
ncbi:endopeptidase La [Oscillospiraceae bacterium CM]|nr:endopeptidase La [Oscillospiraceae bacterium CM]